LRTRKDYFNANVRISQNHTIICQTVTLSNAVGI